MQWIRQLFLDMIRRPSLNSVINMENHSSIAIAIGSARTKNNQYMAINYQVLQDLAYKEPYARVMYRHIMKYNYFIQYQHLFYDKNALFSKLLTCPPKLLLVHFCIISSYLQNFGTALKELNQYSYKLHLISLSTVFS